MFWPIFMCFFYRYWVVVCGRVSYKGLVHNLHMQLFYPGQVKNQSYTNLSFDIVATHNDHPSYVKHLLGSIYLFCPLFWVLGAGGIIAQRRFSVRWTC